MQDAIENRGLRHRAVCRFEELTSDVVLNRALWFATHLLGRLALRSPDIQHQLAWNLMHLSDVTPGRVELHELDRITYGRLNAHYRPAIMLARLVIAHSVFEYAAGDQPGPGFLLDMDNVYEEFRTEVFVQEGAACGLGRQSTTGMRLDLEKHVIIDPDIVLAGSSGMRLVQYAKYERKDRTSDVYQALAYAKGLGLATVALVYPEDGDVVEEEHHIRNDGIVIRIRTIPVGRGAGGYVELDSRASARARQILLELMPTARSAGVA